MAEEGQQGQTGQTGQQQGNTSAQQYPPREHTPENHPRRRRSDIAPLTVDTASMAGAFKDAIRSVFEEMRTEERAKEEAAAKEKGDGEKGKVGGKSGGKETTRRKGSWFWGG